MVGVARWRAVPTAVWTAVGALAFLASSGLAVVLGAGLHVWSGPFTPAAPPNASAAPAGGTGIVTVAPPAAPPTVLRPAGPRTTAPVVPAFVPFSTTPVAVVPAPAAAAPATAVQPEGTGRGHAPGRLFLVREQLLRLSLPLELRIAPLGDTALRLVMRSAEQTLRTFEPASNRDHAHSAMHAKTHAHGPHGHSRPARHHGHGHRHDHHGQQHRHHHGRD
jgi:hypothetical protein